MAEPLVFTFTTNLSTIHKMWADRLEMMDIEELWQAVGRGGPNLKVFYDEFSEDLSKVINLPVNKITSSRVYFKKGLELTFAAPSPKHRRLTMTLRCIAGAPAATQRAVTLLLTKLSVFQPALEIEIVAPPGAKTVAQAAFLVSTMLMKFLGEDYLADRLARCIDERYGAGLNNQINTGSIP